MTVRERLREIAQDAGVTAWVHATRLSGPKGEVTLAGDQPVAVASLYKLPLAIAWADLVSSGALDGGERLVLTPGERTPGPTGIAMLLDEVTLTLRDTVRLMLAVSDNAAGDVVLQRVGLGRLSHWLAEIGLRDTVVRHGSTESLRIVQRETGATSTALAERALADVEHDVVTSQYDSALASSSSAADLCQVLGVLWSRSDPPHALVRDALAHQAWRHRIGSGFPHDDVAVHGKTGTLGRLRHEAAVIGFPGEHPVAVTVLTRAARAERHLPRVDAAIGELARAAVTPLRMSADAIA
ncbi:class A beta-lactamase-related serine hydrolase [Nocardioides sp. LMS-CY]|uniref:serine hydrolase n=1 Tax=Nocardioides sp. (strain LMS-CY) TaxID=2840457 RepID=UPI001C003BEA|nr:serine hydrolase [Nocardioides sp. LMS-CY]QWF22387.1 class A beta-lactamase-related serine hydrolase [Nocardioides sp. LMS-CY]